METATLSQLRTLLIAVTIGLVFATFVIGCAEPRSPFDLGSAVDAKDFWDRKGRQASG